MKMKGKKTETRGGEEKVRIGRVPSRTVEASVRIGLNGGATRADLFQESLLAPSRSLTRPLRHLLGHSPPRSTHTRTTQKP